MHACLAQACLAIAGAVALVTAPSFGREPPRVAGRRLLGDRALRITLVTLCAAIFVQTGLGAAMRHLNAAMAIPDFPLSFGTLIPPGDEAARPEVAINFAHRLGALLVLAIGVPAIAGSIATRRPALIRPAIVLIVLLLLQVFLGASTVWSGRAEVYSTGHAAVGSLVLLTAVVMAIRGFQVVRPAPALAPELPAPSGNPA
jgi:heme A synthase